MPVARITLNFTFTEFKYRVSGPRHQRLIETTRAFYGQNGVEDYVKSQFPAHQIIGDLEGVLPRDASIRNPRWDDDAFALHFELEHRQQLPPNATIASVWSMLEDYSLEDTHYEACEDNGWVLFGRTPGGLPDNRYQFGYIDYRFNRIDVVPVM